MTNRITELLHANGNIGAANGIKVKEMLKLLGQAPTNKNSRNLTAEIQSCRRQWREVDGLENYILSDTSHGYYLPLTADEAVSFLSTQDKRAIQTFSTVKALRQHLKNIGLLS
ncbi:MAG: hypothetical protein J1E96_04520 [Ruminococcus sp.]|nr:hypothetical protein [Ruminococcus sp.]